MRVRSFGVRSSISGLSRTKMHKQLRVTVSRPRVEAIVDAAQTRLEDVRVDLRRRQVGVPEHHLDGAQIGAALEEVRGEGMPHDVRAEHARQLRAPAVRFQNLPEADAAEWPAARVEKDTRRGAALQERAPRFVEIDRNPVRGVVADLDEPILVDLAVAGALT